MPIERIDSLEIADVRKILLRRSNDSRGSFAEMYKESDFKTHGLPTVWRQDNFSFTAKKNVFRGLHFQAPPHAQAKLVQVITGAVLDVIVDIRLGSSTYGQACSVELSKENGVAVFVPEGFAHGFLTLTDDVHAHYKVTSEYAPASEGGLAWFEPKLKHFFAGVEKVLTSDRDAKWDVLNDLESPFSVSS
mgnify:CR=1 FL=1